MEQGAAEYWCPRGRGSMTATGLTESESVFMQSLRPGDPVEIFDDRYRVEWAGIVEETAPNIGVAWVRTHTGDRKLLHIQEHSVRRLLFLP